MKTTETARLKKKKIYKICQCVSMCLSEIEGVIYLCLMLWLDHWVMEYKNWFVNEWIVCELD